MSHEALSERKTYREKYGLQFQPCNSAKTAGISQWRHFLRADHTKPHPFREDELMMDGTYRLGFPGWFDIVDDDQLLAPRDDRGLMTHRRQTLEWRYRPDVLGVGGMSKNEPMKTDEDTCDSCRMITATWAAPAAPFTEAEQVENLIPEGWRRGDAPDMTNWQREGWEIARAWQMGEAKEKFKKQHRNLDEPFEPASPFANTAEDYFNGLAQD